MMNTNETPYRLSNLNLSASEKLENFVRTIDRRFEMTSQEEPTPEQLAHEARMFFGLGIPVAHQLQQLLRTCEINLSYSINLPPRSALYDIDREEARYKISIPYNGGTYEAVGVLHEFYEILFQRCRFKVSWWTEWMYVNDTWAPHDLSDRFAWAVILPPKLLREKTQEVGLNPWTLAGLFYVSAGKAAKAIVRMVWLPCPYFYAHLNLAVPPEEQRSLNFGEPTVMAEVWTRQRKFGPPGHELCGEIEELARRFPKRGNYIPLDGVLLRAMKERREIMERTNMIAGIRLPKPVYVVARPNGDYQNQMFIQVMPCGFEQLFVDKRQAAQGIQIPDVLPARPGYSSSQNDDFNDYSRL